MISFNLYEVKDLGYNCFYNTISPTGYLYFLSMFEIYWFSEYVKVEL